MHESEIMTSVARVIEYESAYSNPELYMTTSSSVLYRVRKAGKYFIIKTSKNNSGQSVALLQREYELSLGKSHPNIVNVFTYETDTVVGPGIVMEYVDGRTLADFLAEKPSLAMRMRVFTQLLQAVGYIHRCGLVHNDIKPENILITRTDNDVKLIDFGLADSDAYYLARTLGCTPAYASPELLAQESDIDARSDIYSLGVIMKELFGKRYQRIAGRCLSHARNRRYNNADELFSAIRHKNTPLYIISSVIAAILLLLPLIYLCKEVSAQKENKAKENEFIVKVEKEVESIYAITADSLSHAVYYEFAANNILTFWESLAAYNKEKIVTITPKSLCNVISAAYAHKVADCNERLCSIAKTLPSYSKSNLTIEEIMFYNKLIEKRMPYQPYEK